MTPVLSERVVNGTDYIVGEITIAPQDSTGWHTHRGLVYDPAGAPTSDGAANPGCLE